MSTRFPLAAATALAMGLAAAGAAAQPATNLVLESRIPFPPCTTGDVWAIGEYMLLARRNEGFAVVDARDPRNPIAKTIRPPGYPAPFGSYGVGDIKADQRYIYATDEATGKGVFIYDAMPDPMNPVLVGTLQNTSVHNCWVDGDWLYAQTQIYDISDRSNPKRVAQLGTAFAHDVLVLDGRAYLSIWNGGIAIYDVRNPRLPSLIATKNYSGAQTHNMWPSEDRNYLFTTDEKANGFVRVWDISALPTMTQVATYQVGPATSSVHNVQVAGDLLFVSYYMEGLHVLDIRDPRHPVEIANFDTYAPTTPGCFGGPYAGNWGVYPWDLTRVFVSDMDSGGYILRLNPIRQTFMAQASTVPPGGTIDLRFAYSNAAVAPLNGFGVVLLTGINNSPVTWSLLAEIALLQPAQTVNRQVLIPVPAGFPIGWAVQFTGYTGLVNPLSVSETAPVTVTIR